VDDERPEERLNSLQRLGKLRKVSHLFRVGNIVQSFPDRGFAEGQGFEGEIIREVHAKPVMIPFLKVIVRAEELKVTVVVSPVLPSEDLYPAAVCKVPVEVKIPTLVGPAEH